MIFVFENDTTTRFVYGPSRGGPCAVGRTLKTHLLTDLFIVFRRPASLFKEACLHAGADWAKAHRSSVRRFMVRCQLRASEEVMLPFSIDQRINTQGS